MPAPFSTFLAVVVSSAMALTTPAAKPKILSVGLSAIDFVATVDQFPQPDDKIRSTSLVAEGGGNAANSACAMGRLDPYVDVTLLTAVGDDANGDSILSGVQQYNVQCQAQRFEGSSPFTYILVTDDAEGDSTRTCIHQPATGDLTTEFVLEQVDLSEFDAVHYDLRYPTAAMALAEKCTQINKPYSVDVERPREGLVEIMQGASVVVCTENYFNTVEWKEGEETNLSVEEKLVTIMERQAPQAKVAVVTLGSKGCCLVQLNASSNGSTTSNGESSISTVKDPKEWNQRALLAARIANDAQFTTSSSVEATMVAVNVQTKSSDDAEEEILLQDASDSNVPTVTLSRKNLKDHTVLFCSAFGGCNVVDTTGAGDSFIGGFLTAYWNAVVNTQDDDDIVVSPMALAHALRVSSRVASQKIQQMGARKGLPKAQEDSFIQEEMKAIQELATSAVLQEA